MPDSSIASCVVGMFLTATLTSCSLLVHTSDRQCKTDSECVDAQLGARCMNEVCVPAAECVGDSCGMMSPPITVGPCANDQDCKDPDTPRCLSKTCVSREVGERWICEADDKTVRSTTVRYGFRIVDYLSRLPPKNIVVKACRTNDVGCEEPVSTWVDTDGTGHAQFDLPQQFFGFFDIQSDSLPTLLYVTKPIIKHTLNRDLPMLTADTVNLLAGVVGIPYDKSKGLTLLEAIDCTDTPAGGIHFTMMDATADPFYVVDQVPTLEAKVSSYDEVNNTANGGFLNVPPGFITFGARLGVDGLELGTFNARIRGETITFINMHF